VFVKPLANPVKHLALVRGERAEHHTRFRRACHYACSTVEASECTVDRIAQDSAIEGLLDEVDSARLSSRSPRSPHCRARS
jgi:hypothetical protein